MPGTSGSEADFTLDTSNLTQVLAEVKSVSPTLARELRKRLRGTGEEIVAAQRAILDGPLPSGIRKTGTRMKLVKTRGSNRILRRVNVYEDAEVGRSRSTGMRAGIKKSLKTRVVAGKTRQGVNVRAERRVGGVMVNAWQARRFRHPVFGTQEWAVQKGQPYFWKPAMEGRDSAARKIGQAIDDALAEISD